MTTPTHQESHRQIPTMITIAAIIVCADTLSKILAVHFLIPGHMIPILGPHIGWLLVRNSGAAFSFATGHTFILTLISCSVVAVIAWISAQLFSRTWAIGLGMILGGALGNLIDRFLRSPGHMHGHVVDFIAIGWWPVFNLADSAVVLGTTLLAILGLRGISYTGTNSHTP